MNGMHSNNFSGDGSSESSTPDLLYLCLRNHDFSFSSERKSFVAKEDKMGYSGMVEDRDQVRIEFDQSPVSEEDAGSMLVRLQQWDPFWDFTGPVLIGKLARILVPELTPPPREGFELSAEFKRKAKNVAKQGKFLRSAIKLAFKPNVDLKPEEEEDVFKIIPFPNWQNPLRTRFENGEGYLILRMLPVVPQSEATPGKPPRPDCHIWPKGTFLQHNGDPVFIRQRKMDPKKRAWQHNDSKAELQVLDLTFRIKDPRTEQTLELCCYDDDPFLFCVSICKYRSADTVYKALTSEKSPERLQTLPYDLGLQRITKQANPIVLEDDLEDSPPAGDTFAYFSLLCPISMLPLTCPVRGRQCSHFQVRRGIPAARKSLRLFSRSSLSASARFPTPQFFLYACGGKCFDLKAFVELNERQSSGRWRCAVRECNRFLSVRDLERCELTARAIEEHGPCVTVDRHRIQFHSSGTFRLLREEEARPRGADAGVVD
jgi:hypothetical protein